MRRLILIATLALALAGAIAACGGSSGSGTATGGATPGASATSAAAAIWNQQCTGCHSADPAGVGVADAKQVRRVVEHGVEGMPAFAGKLSAADIRAVSEYVANASKQ